MLNAQPFELYVVVRYNISVADHGRLGRSACRRTAVEILGDLLEALGLILGSFVVAIGLTVGGWTVFSRTHHPEWGEPAIVLLLIVALVTHLVEGQFLLMVTILMAIAIPFAWVEGRAWRDRGSTSGSGIDLRKFR